jgi:hypothetical protein
MSLKDKIQEIEYEEIIKALQENDWVMARAAKKLGITERMIGYKIKKYGIRKKFEGVEGKDITGNPSKNELLAPKKSEGEDS